MMLFKVIIEGLGLGLLISLYCALGIRNGAIGLVHLYSYEVQMRTVQMGMTTQKEIQKRGKSVKLISAFTYLVYVLVCIIVINEAKGFLNYFWQILVILEIANMIDRLVIDEYWVGHSKAWIIPGTEDLRPYISATDKKKKWIAGTLGFAFISAVVALIMQICRH